MVIPPLTDYLYMLGPFGIVLWAILLVINWLKSLWASLLGVFNGMIPPLNTELSTLCSRFLSFRIEYAVVYTVIPWTTFGICLLIWTACLAAVVVAKLSLRALSLTSGGGGGSA